MHTIKHRKELIAHSINPSSYTSKRMSKASTECSIISDDKYRRYLARSKLYLTTTLSKFKGP